MNIPPKINRLIGQAMHTYGMLADGDRILVAVSGGIDSLVLAVVLQEWRKKAPIHYDLIPVHIDMGIKDPLDEPLRRQLAPYNLSVLRVEQSPPEGHDQVAGGNTCFLCSRNRRTRLFSLAREMDCNKLALGHHKDDLIETFLINVFYAGNISTMLPAQPLFEGKLTVIRPLALLSKDDIKRLAHNFALSAVAGSCPLAVDTERDAVRQMLDELYLRNPSIRGNIFKALSNVREDYLL